MRTEEAFAVVLRRLRLNQDLSQVNLALKSDLDRTFVSLLERGLRQPTLNTIFVLSRALGLHPSALIEQVEHILDADSPSTNADK